TADVINLDAHTPPAQGEPAAVWAQVQVSRAGLPSGHGPSVGPCEVQEDYLAVGLVVDGQDSPLPVAAGAAEHPARGGREPPRGTDLHLGGGAGVRLDRPAAQARAAVGEQPLAARSEQRRLVPADGQEAGLRAGGHVVEANAV